MTALALSSQPLILAIDPGPEKSAWLEYRDRPEHFGITANDELLNMLRFVPHHRRTTVVIENIEPRYGLYMGWETLDTARWIGRFEEAAQPAQVVLVRRSAVLRHLGVVTTARKGEKRASADSGAWQALLDRYGGKEAAVGRKANPGPLWGISRDCRSALAIAVTYADGGHA